MPKIVLVGRVLAVLAPCAASLAAGVADAAQLDLSGGVLRYEAAAYVANDLTVSLASGRYTVDDPAEERIALGASAVAAGCTAFDDDTVSCPSSPVTSIDVDLSNEADTAVLVGPTAPARVVGGSGADVFLGGAGDDTFVWGPGEGSDVIDGGAGLDTVEFNASNAAEVIAVTADGAGFVVCRATSG